MPLLIDQKYANIISSKLELFKWQGVAQQSANFRCPLCGDSKKQKTKKRGYFYTMKDTLMMKCHNCSASLPFSAFLKRVDPQVYRDYTRDAFKFNNEHRWYAKKAVEREKRVLEVVKPKKIPAPTDVLCSVMDLDAEHPCKLYVRARKIPMKFWRGLFFTENYQRWIREEVDQTKFHFAPKTDPRLVIPFIDPLTKKQFAFQGRILDKDPSKIRYITINPSDSLLVFGEERLDKTKKIKYVCEGPIDSLYLDNAIAAAGSSLSKVTGQGYTFVFDNEPRGTDICLLMEKVIRHGDRLVIWPDRLTDNDVGKMVENGMSTKDVDDILRANTFRGLEAQLKFNKWKQI